HEELHRRTGRGPSLTQAFPKLLWLVQNEPQVAERAYKFIDVHGYLVQRLTGAWTTSLASADSFGLTEVKDDAWAEDLITGIGLRADQFCTTVKPGTIIGEVSAEAAQVTGLPQGMPVVAGLGDRDHRGLARWAHQGAPVPGHRGRDQLRVPAGDERHRDRDRPAHR